jgi:hypothetical protein
MTAPRPRRDSSLVMARTGMGKLPSPFEPGLTAPHPPGHCLCTWTYTPQIGGKQYPWALKFRNRACPVSHIRVARP